MAVFTLLFSLLVGIRVAGNISKLVYTPELIKAIDAAAFELNKTRPGYANFLWSSMGQQRWIQEQAYRDPVNAASDILGAAVGIRGLQLGLPLGVRIARVLGTRTLIRRWDDFARLVYDLFTGRQEEVVREIVGESLSLAQEAESIALQGYNLAEDIYGIASGSPINIPKVVTLGPRFLKLFNDMFSFYTKVRDRLPEKEKERAERPVGWRDLLQTYGILYQEFTEPSPPAVPPPPPPGSVSDDTDFINQQWLRQHPGVSLPPNLEIVQDNAQKVASTLRNAPRVTFGDLRRIIQELKRTA